MKVLVDGLCPAHIYVVRKIDVNAKHPVAGRALGLTIEMNDLRHGVYAGIRSPSTCYLDWFVCDFRQRILDNSLNAYTVPLPLPAVIGRAVVLDTEH